MASIHKIGDKWRAVIRRKGHKPTSKYFDTRSKAKAWADKIEKAIDEGRPAAAADGLTVGSLIERYRGLREKARPISDSSNEHYQLASLMRILGERPADRVTTDDLVGWAQRRADEGAGPYTVNMDLSKLGTVYRYGGMGLGLTDPTVAARPLLHHLGLISGGGKRERRPTEEELRLIVEWLGENKGAIYAEAVAFTAITAMRRGEVVSVLWKDVDEKKRLVGCWRKHPRKGKTWEQVPLLPPAWEILQRLPREDERVFPCHEQTLSKYFKEACDAYGIPDLHFHDLRHEGTSRLFEQGYAIEQVALVTGHKDWRNLRRYTNLKPESLSIGTDRDK